MSRLTVDKKSDQVSVRSTKVKAGGGGNRSTTKGSDHDADSQKRSQLMSDGHSDRHSHSLGGHAKKDGLIVYQNTYRLEPEVTFDHKAVKNLAMDVLSAALQGVVYSPEKSRQLCQDLATSILAKVKDLHFRRYKVVSMVSIGSLKENPGILCSSRCLWATATDTFATVQFSNASLFAVASVYGLYCE